VGVTPSAGRKPALAFFPLTVLVLLSVTLLAGCGSSSDRGAITALVDRFMGVVSSPEGTARAEELGGIFAGLDPSEASTVLQGLPPASPGLAYAVRGVRFLPLGGAEVTVDLEGDGTSTALVMRARKVGGAWRLEPSFRVRQRLGEVKVPGG
jgi:hypothetical protein